MRYVFLRQEFYVRFKGPEESAFYPYPTETISAKLTKATV